MVLTDLSLLVNCAIRLAVIKIEFRLGLLALLIEEGQVVDWEDFGALGGTWHSCSKAIGSFNDGLFEEMLFGRTALLLGLSVAFETFEWGVGGRASALIIWIGETLDGDIAADWPARDWLNTTLGPSNRSRRCWAQCFSLWLLGRLKLLLRAALFQLIALRHSFVHTIFISVFLFVS